MQAIKALLELWDGVNITVFHSEFEIFQSGCIGEDLPHGSVVALITAMTVHYS